MILCLYFDFFYPLDKSWLTTPFPFAFQEKSVKGWFVVFVVMLKIQETKLYTAVAVRAWFMCFHRLSWILSHSVGCNVDLPPNLTFDLGNLGAITSWLFLRMVHFQGFTQQRLGWAYQTFRCERSDCLKIDKTFWHAQRENFALLWFCTLVKTTDGVETESTFFSNQLQRGQHKSRVC